MQERTPHSGALRQSPARKINLALTGTGYTWQHAKRGIGKTVGMSYGALEKECWRAVGRVGVRDGGGLQIIRANTPAGFRFRDVVREGDKKCHRAINCGAACDGDDIPYE